MKNNEHEDVMMPMGLGFFSQEQTSVLSRFYLDESITEPAYYRNLIQVLLTASESDLIELQISSCGGQLDSTEAIITAIRQTEAMVVAVVHKAYSAASMIALACHEIVLNDFSTFMIHSASYQTGGSHNNVRDYADFSERKLNKLFDDVYSGFLTEEEMTKVKSGTEIWLLSDEIGERLEKRTAYFQAKFEAEQKATEQKQEKPVRKRRTPVAIED